MNFMKLCHLPLLALLLTSCPQAEQLSRQMMTHDEREEEKELIAAHVAEYDKAQAEKMAQFEKELYHKFKTADEARKAEEGSLQARRDVQVATEIQRQREGWEKRQEAIVREFQKTGRDNLNRMFEEAKERAAQEKLIQHEVNSQAAEQQFQMEMQERAIQAERVMEEEARRFYGR